MLYVHPDIIIITNSFFFFFFKFYQLLEELTYISSGFQEHI